MQFILISIFLISAQVTSFAQFKEGFIIDKYGQKFPGFINFIEGQSLSYKEKKSGKKEEFTIHDLNGFVVERDSFYAVRNYRLTSKTTINGFARVLIKRPDKLLSSVSSFRTSKSTAIVHTKETTHYLIVGKTKTSPLTKSNFLKEMPLLVDDQPELKQKILARELTFDDIETIISVYRNPKKASD